MSNNIAYRRIDLDILRIIAIFFVIFAHTGAAHRYLYLDLNNDNILKIYFYTITSIIATINVPLFFIISGTLLLENKNETYLCIFNKRILRIIFALLFGTFILFIGKIFINKSFLNINYIVPSYIYIYIYIYIFYLVW